MALTRKIYYSSLQVGDEIPAWQSPPLERIQIARYAGAAGDFNPLYVDEPFARAAGFRSVIAPGALGMGGLSQMLTEWLKGPFLKRLHAKFLKIMWPGDILTCRGRVTGKHRETITGSRSICGSRIRKGRWWSGARERLLSSTALRTSRSAWPAGLR
jgi:acyl dehydratase